MPVVLLILVRKTTHCAICNLVTHCASIKTRSDRTRFPKPTFKAGGSLNRLGLKKYLAADENDLVAVTGDDELVTVKGIPEEIVVQFL